MRGKWLTAVEERLQEFERTGDASTVLEPEALAEASRLATVLEDNEDDKQVLGALGWFHWRRSQALRQGEDGTDLQTAIEMFSRVFLSGTVDVPKPLLPYLLDELAVPAAIEMMENADDSPQVDAYDAVVFLWQRIVQLTPEDDANRWVRFSNLGLALRSKFRRCGDPEVLDEAMSAYEQAFELTAEDSLDRARVAGNIGITAYTTYTSTGDPDALGAAVIATKLGLLLLPRDDPGRGDELINLGVILSARYELHHAATDLTASIDALTEALHVMPSDHPHRAMALSSLGNALTLKFARTLLLADLDAAVAYAREATRIAADAESRMQAENNLARKLWMRSQIKGATTDLTESIDRLTETLHLLPDDHPDRAVLLSNLGTTRVSQYERTNNAADLDAAIATLQDAVPASPDKLLAQIPTLASLGRALRIRFERTGDQEDLHEAVAAFTRIYELSSAAPSERLNAAWRAAQLLADSDPARASDLAEAAVQLLPLITPRRLAPGDQQYQLSVLPGLAREAAALALADPRATDAERASRALRLLEQGRGVMLGQAIETRNDLSELRRTHPELAAHFIETRDRLDEHAAATDGPGVTTSEAIAHRPRPYEENEVADRKAVAEDLARILAEIRSLPGFASFGLPPALDELLASTGQGAVVVLNVSRYRSDALLLTRDGLIHRELPQLTDQAVQERTDAFQHALRTARSCESGEEEREAARGTVSSILEWLWDAAAGPVLETLGYGPADADWPRVWWVPGGLLSLLPLHAAGYHDDPADAPDRRNVLDRVVSSYTPTVRALGYARDRARQQASLLDTEPRALIVAMPITPGLSGGAPLRFVNDEVAMLRQRLPRSILLRVPDSGVPTKASVLARLPDCPVVHFACHGSSDPKDPSNSLLLLHDHGHDPFTVASLRSVTLEQAQLAYLSACRTAAIDAANLSDESIHLTSAFHLAGFSQVVGTLWEIDDEYAVTVADSFYAALRTPTGLLDPARAARALHQAVRTLRESHSLLGKTSEAGDPLPWAAHLHVGM
ncbi:CHAT domain-containing protein [Streptomyces asiaticus]